MWSRLKVRGRDRGIVETLPPGPAIGLCLEERFAPNRPECEDEGFASVADPLFGEIESEIAGAVDLERGISDEQSGVVLGEHCFDLWSHGGEGSAAAQPFFKENFVSATEVMEEVSRATERIFSKELCLLTGWTALAGARQWRHPAGR